MDPSTPLGYSPDGSPPDFDGRTSMQIEFIIVACATFGISTVLLALRLYTSLCLTKNIGWDAFFLCLAWLAGLAFFVICVVAMDFGFGRHYWNITQGQLQQILKLYPSIAIMYILPPALTKLSMLVIFYAIDKDMGFRYYWVLVAAVTAIPIVVATALIAGPCSSLIESVMCLNRVVIAQSATNIFSDLMLIAMPIPMLVRLHMPKRRKITLGLLLSFGSSAVIISIIRTAYIQSFSNDPDFLWNASYLAIWSGAEIAVSIICTCLAMMQPFVRRHMPVLASKVFGLGSSRGDTNGARALGYYSNERSRHGGGGTANTRRGSGGGMPGLTSTATVTSIPPLSRKKSTSSTFGLHGRTDPYELHSVDRSGGAHKSDEESLGGRHTPGGIQITSEYIVSSSAGKPSASATIKARDDASSESERRIMDDFS